MQFITPKALERFCILFLFATCLLYYTVAAETMVRLSQTSSIKSDVRSMLFFYLPVSFFLIGYVAYVIRSVIIGFAVLPPYILSVTFLLLLILT